MKKIKDFIYNWNDLIVILFILAAAAAVIYWRVTLIQDYPRVLAAEISATVDETSDTKDAITEILNQGKEKEESEASNQEDSDAEADTDADADTKADDSNDNSDQEKDDDDAKDEETAPEPGSGPPNNRIWTGGILRSDVTVTTAEGSAEEAAQALIDAGLFTSYEDFEAVCEINHLDPTDIKASTFTFTKGTTQAMIAEEVTKPME